MSRAAFFVPFVAVLLIAAAPLPPPTQASVNPTPEIAGDPTNRLTLELSNGGRVVILLRPDLAPNHVERIRTLVQNGFYNGTPFHRVIPGFMAQGGDPTGTGQGDSPLPDLKAEFSTVPHLRGTVSMARTDDPDTANSQFFIMFGPNVSLDKKYTVVGRVVEGMAAVDSIAPGEPPAQPTRIVRASLAAPVASDVAMPVPVAAPAQAAAAEAPAQVPAAEVQAPAPAEPQAPATIEAPAPEAVAEEGQPAPATVEQQPASATAAPAAANSEAPAEPAADELAPAPEARSAADELAPEPEPQAEVEAQEAPTPQ